MKFLKNRRFGRIAGCVALLALPIFLFTSDTVFQAGAGSSSFDDLVANAEFCGFEAGHQGFKCVHVPGFVDICLHPDTDRAMAEEILRNLPTYLGIPEGAGKDAYYLNGARWSTTATDGATGVQGDPITLTWGFVPDGTNADGAPSDLFAVFNAQFGGTAWQNKIRNAFDRWTAVCGVNHVEVSDDGAVLPGSPGILGVRGDCRLSGRSIDGPLNVLAYNFYPNGGDMVIDTDDAGFYGDPTYNFATLKNVVAHEHGHGMGLGHTTPEDCTKLMEAYACGGGSFIGPQDDDIRGAVRYYGDIYENNDARAEAYALGALTDTILITAAVERGDDVDWYSFTGSGAINIAVDPIGSAYYLGYQYGPAPTYVRTDSITDPDFCLYNSAGVLLDSLYTAGYTETEVLTGYNLPSAGTYLIKVFRKEATGNGVQRYDMSIIQSSVITDVQIADAPARALDFQLAPNPFNPLTTAKFFASRAGEYTMDVYDVSGRLTRRVTGTAPAAGWVEVPWNGTDQNGSDVASGVYLMRLTQGDRSEVKRAVLVR